MKHIIIIDDDVSIREVFSLVFERAGYAVITLEDEKRIFTGDFTEPDIFIIDRQLRGADGFDICRFLKKRPNNFLTPVIMFSAGAHMAQQATDMGADAFIEKPFANKDLIALVERILSEEALKTNLP